VRRKSGESFSLGDSLGFPETCEVEIELEALDLSPAVPAENAQSGLSNLQSRWNAQG
jgi:hypothetical protein